MGLGYGNLIASSIGTPGAALASSTTQTSLLHKTMIFSMPARYLRQFSSGVGAQFHWHLEGIISTLVTSPGTLTFVAKVGSIAVFTSQAIPLNVLAKTNTPWYVDLDLELTALGTSATLAGSGKFCSEAYIGTVIAATGPAPGVIQMPAAGYTVGSAFDEAVAADWDFTGQWSVSNAANSIQCKQSRLFQFN